jgi:hypothetical protein
MGHMWARERTEIALPMLQELVSTLGLCVAYGSLLIGEDENNCGVSFPICFSQV